MKGSGVVRVHAGRRAQAARPLPADRQRASAVVKRTAGHNHRRDACLTCAPDHVLAVPIETVVREIGPDIDQRESSR
jgi:hypothetical protein